MIRTCDDLLCVDSQTPPCVHSKRTRVYRHHAHVLKHMCAWCWHTRGRFESTHGFFHVSSACRNTHTPHTKHTHTPNTHHDHNDTHTTQHNITRRQRERDRERQRETERDRERKQRKNTERERREDERGETIQKQSKEGKRRRRDIHSHFGSSHFFFERALCFFCSRAFLVLSCPSVYIPVL